jgi:uncharacterized protein YhaN
MEWRRGNEAVFGFDVLSTGAREQFAAALRVTMAEVLAKAYEGTLPVLFDDAFANSDPERQAGVYRMLQKPRTNDCRSSCSRVILSGVRL